MPDRYIGWTRFFDDACLGRLATPALRAELAGPADEVQRSAFSAHGHGDSMDGAFRVDLETYLPDDLLTMADRMSMAHSLELRAPFCDHRLIELSLAIAPAVKLARGRLKAVLKAAFADVLPRELLTRRKQGFMIPLGRWLRTDLREAMEDLLSGDRVRARGLFAPTVVETLKREQARINAEVQDAEAQLATDGEKLNQAKEVIDLALELAKNCGASYRRARPDVRKIGTAHSSETSSSRTARSLDSSTRSPSPRCWVHTKAKLWR